MDQFYISGVKNDNEYVNLKLKDQFRRMTTHNSVPMSSGDRNDVCKLTTVTSTQNTSNPYCILSWNINKYDKWIHHWLAEVLRTNRPDVIFLSEIKVTESELIRYFSDTNYPVFAQYKYIISAHQPAGHHGVAFLIRKDHHVQQYNVNLNIPPRSDNKSGDAATGRLLSILLNNEIIIVGTYSPNSGAGRIPLKNLAYRISTWDPALYYLLNEFKKMKPTIWLGDINVAPTHLDVSYQFQTRQAGFTIEERNSFLNFITSPNTTNIANTTNTTNISTTGSVANKLSWIDIWRKQHLQDRVYTWIGSKNKHNESFGMRLDNIIISIDLLNRALNSFIMPPQYSISSDHVPIGVYIRREQKL